MTTPPTNPPPPAGPTAPLVGQVLDGRYRVLFPIARGGMGMVYEARDERLGRKVAIKVLLPELAHDSTCRERFSREAHAVARTSHPSLVQIHDLMLEGTPAYFVLELVEGTSLQTILGEEGRLPWARAVRLMIQVLDALQCLHDAGVIHRDLKPANVLVVGSGQSELAKVIDLGVAQLTTGAAYQRLTASGVIVGTPAYMSPEQLAGERVGPATDLWAAGVLAFHLLTGERPFGAKELRALLDQVLRTEVPDVRTRAPDVPASVALIVRRLLERAPDARPSSARATADALRDTLAQSASEPGSVSLGASVAGLSAPGSQLGARLPDASTLNAPGPRPAAVAPVASGHTQVLLGSRSAAVWAARLAALGVVATCLVGSGVGAFVLWLQQERASTTTTAPVAGPAPAIVPGLPSARVLSITYSGPMANEAMRLVAPALDPRLRSCVPELSSHGLGMTVAGYNVFIDPGGTPTRLAHITGSASAAETACIEAALMSQRWPAPLPMPDNVATVILMPAY